MIMTLTAMPVGLSGGRLDRITYLTSQAEELIADKRQRIEEQLRDVLDADVGDLFETFEVATSEAFPFQMTAENLARHADDPNAPFWDMLKNGSDAFLATGQ